MLQNTDIYLEEGCSLENSKHHYDLRASTIEIDRNIYDFAKEKRESEVSAINKPCLKRGRGRPKQPKSTQVKSESLHESGKTKKGRKTKKFRWSSDNVLVALSEIIKNKEDHAKNVKVDCIQLAKNVGNALQLRLSRDQMYAKVRNMRLAYYRMEKAIKEGNQNPFKNEHDKDIYALSKIIWGSENDEIKEGLEEDAEDDLNENIEDAYDGKDKAHNISEVVIGSGGSGLIFEDMNLCELNKKNDKDEKEKLLSERTENSELHCVNLQPRNSSEKIEADERPRADQLISGHVSNVSTNSGSAKSIVDVLSSYDVTNGFHADTKEAESSKSLPGINQQQSVGIDTGINITHASKRPRADQLISEDSGLANSEVNVPSQHVSNGLPDSGVNSDFFRELQNSFEQVFEDMHIKFVNEVKSVINDVVGSATFSDAKFGKAIDGQGSSGYGIGTSGFDQGTNVYGEGMSGHGHGTSCFGQDTSSYMDQYSATKRHLVEQESQLQMDKMKLRTRELQLMLEKCKLKQEKLHRRVRMFQ